MGLSVLHNSCEGCLTTTDAAELSAFACAQHILVNYMLLYCINLQKVPKLEPCLAQDTQISTASAFHKKSNFGSVLRILVIAGWQQVGGICAHTCARMISSVCVVQQCYTLLHYSCTVRADGMVAAQA